MSVHAGNIEAVFTYHTPDADQVSKMNEIRAAAHHLASLILKYVPSCSDQQDAIRSVRNASMTANAGIILQGNM